MVAMTAEEHDELTADAEFVTHLTGRILDRHMLPATPVSSREYAALCDVAEMTSGDTLDMFYGLYKYNPNAKEAMAKMRENLARIERQLAGKEAYLTAKAELQNSERQKLLAETRHLLEQIALEDPYFIEKKLYPNVDFYSGIIYRALGIPTDMFTVMFAMGRLPGWIAQWKEMRENKEPIGRPRQVYTGEQDVPYTAIDKR